MAEIFVTEEELRKGIALASGQRWRVVVTRTPTLARVFGTAFNTNRSQLLAGNARKLIRIRSFLQERSPAHLLIVGHCDTTGDDAVNDPLSLERADNTLAFVQDDPEPWLAMYGTNKGSRRWDRQEDLVMISAAKGFSAKPRNQDPVVWFQETRKLQVDGDAGPETRGALIREYMALDGPPSQSSG